MEVSFDSREKWLEFRKTKIGASDAPAILGLSPWTTPYQLWQQKLGMVENKDNLAMQRGRDLEERARQSFERECGYDCPAACFVCNFSDQDYMMASLDGWNKDHRTLVEIKCPGQEDHDMALQCLCPAKYIPQLQHQMYVMDVDVAHYWSFDGERGALVLIPRDDNFIKDLVEKERDFYHCMLTMLPPELSDRDFEDRYDAEWAAAADLYKAAKTTLDLAEEMKANAHKRLIELAGKRNSKGYGVRVSKIVRKGNIDYGFIPELKNVDLDAYRKPNTESWRITQGVS